MAIYAKLLNVTSKIKGVPKNGYNSFHKYKFVQDTDLTEYVRKFLVEEGVMLLPSFEKQTIMPQASKEGETYLTSVEGTITFVDTEDGSSVTVHAQGQGQDKGDKGVYKAMTGFMKYGLMKTFMIPTGDDPERDEEDAKPTKPTPVASLKMLYETAAKLGVTQEQLDAALVNSPELNIQSVNDLTPSQIQKFLTVAQQKPETFKKAVFGNDNGGSARAAS